MEDNEKLVLDVNENPKKVSEWFLFAIQHILAMLVACITVPILTGLPIAPTILAAGIGTLFYIFVTKQKSPVFLSSSFAYLSPMASALAIGMIGEASGNNYLALILGMTFVGLVYVAIAILIRFLGTEWLNKLLPPVVIGPIIMVIGLSLAGSAIKNLDNTFTGNAADYNLISILCGLIGLIVTACASHYGRGKMISLIPFVIGMLAGYVSALIFTIFGHIFTVDYLKIIDFSPFTRIFGENNFSFASIINYKIFVPNDDQSMIFLRFDQIKSFDWKTIGEVALLFIPVSLVTICEHVGDHKNLGNIIHKDLLNDEPGMTRTLIGDGVATALSGAISGAANTTYGENVAVIGATKIASVKVILLAAIMTIVFSFITPITAFLETIPNAVTGGVSLVLYGFIASSGVNLIIREKVDFMSTRNIFIMSSILVAGIGGLTLKFGNPVNPTITITSIAVAMLLGILLNLILRDKKEVKEEVVTEDAKEEQVE